jgi:glycosyltransferase involved in cell wall biosynthesis
MQNNLNKIAVVIPCYKVKNKILSVIELIGNEVDNIYVIDDFCPERSGDFVKKHCNDERVNIIYHKVNLGVGAAVISGYKAAINDNCDVIVKIDGDNQMDPRIINNFVSPIANGYADYAKGNRFHNIESVLQMPNIRIFGNAALSVLTKISSGYWNIFDPTNGYTAISSKVAKLLPHGKISNRFFFETDILFRLNTLKAVVIDVPIQAKYEDEKSNLEIRKIIFEFSYKHVRNFLKRVFYNYYLRDVSIASFQLPLAITFLIFGIVYGLLKWNLSMDSLVTASAGTVMLSALPIIIGFQLLMSFISYDIGTVPKTPIHPFLS